MVTLPPDAEMRRQYALRKVWVPYPQAEKLLTSVSSLRRDTPPLRARSILIWGRSGVGKSAFLNKIIRQFPDPDFHEPNSGVRPKQVVYLEAPSFADELSFYDAIIESLDVYPPRGNIITWRRAVYNHITIASPWALIIDEIHNFNAFFGVGGQICLNAIRRLCNQRSLSLICFGTAAGQGVINSDEQLQHRFAVHELLPLGREEFELFIQRLTRVLGLQADTRWTHEMVDYAYDISEGYVGRVADLVQEAAALAIVTDVEAITFEILRSDELVSALVGRAVARKQTGAGRRRR